MLPHTSLILLVIIFLGLLMLAFFASREVLKGEREKSRWYWGDIRKERD
jgi:hypothetical protein